MKTKFQSLHSASRRGRSRGIALVVTLIMLAIITFMAITLLVVTRSEKGSVAGTHDQTTASYANDLAIERLKIQLLAPIIAFTNPYTGDLIVSTNYFNPAGFIATGPGRTAFTNVSYTYANGKPLNVADSIQNLLNQLYLPSPPVWMTNRLGPPNGSNEFRSYLDLNRNSRFDATGLQPVVNANGIVTTNGVAVSNYVVGDPQWIGVLEKPGFPHSATNRYIGRYCFLGVPLSQTLDLNYSYNYAKDGPATMLAGNDSFFRNMGIGTWEINLAAFLVDLNTNIWQPAASPYTYYALGNTYLQPNRGVAFEDALSLLRYRYAGNWKNSLYSVNAMFGVNGTTAFPGDGIDGYTHGPAMTGTTWRAAPDNDRPLTSLGWAGSDNPNHFFTMQDLFDVNKAGTLAQRLIASTTSSNTYDRSTFTRWLSQMSSDSAPETDKIHLNYRNIDNNGVVQPNMATNFIPWIPSQFFTNVAARLLANAGYSVGPPGSPTNILVRDNLGRTNLHIPIWPTNYYNESVQQMLQMAANIYDASTNRTMGAANATNGFPTVFRPKFESVASGKAGGTHVFIVDYQEEQDASLALAPPPMRDLNIANDRAALGPNKRDLVYGFPLIVGAKKGFPNFNEFAMETTVSVTRKMQIIAPANRNPRTVRPTQTNQMYVVSISNVFGIEGWNSYSNSYPRPLSLIIGSDMTAVVTNEAGRMLMTNRYLVGTNQAIPVWEGFRDMNHPGNSFKVPFPPATSHFLFLTNSTYSHSGDSFVQLTGRFEPNQSPAFALPHWWLQLNTRLRFILVDTGVTPNRIVDYVNLASVDSPIDITHELTQGADCTDTYHPPPAGQRAADGLLWCTNRNSPVDPTFGSRLQLDVSSGLADADWKKAQAIFPGSGLNDQNAAVDFFRTNLLGLPPRFGSRSLYVTNIFYTPFNPTRTLFITTSWQVNDPLVHYTIGSLEDHQNLQATNHVQVNNIYSQTKIANIGRVNNRYEPWGGGDPLSPSRTKTAIQLKDPLVTRSDDWDFPTNKFPNIGWLGRVHRGSPWQTIYLKSSPIDVTNWVAWSGNLRTITNFGQINTNIVNLPVTVAFPATNWTYDVQFTFPTNDWSILELFTTAFNDNAARGRLSVNQTNLAAWSAVLGGVVALKANTNAAVGVAGTNYQPVVIEPAGVLGDSSPLGQLVTAINDVRRTNYGGAFKKLGDVLAVPEFSVSSPFLSLTNITGTKRDWSVNDAVCERLPQQILSLLTLDRSPRYLIYSWGQALKPANRSIVTASGPAFGLCTNYQITAETASRTIVRVTGLPDNPHIEVEKFNVLPPD